MEAKSSLGSNYERSSRYKALSSSSEPHSAFSFLGGDDDERLPPPIDPAVFRGVSEIRKLVDDASDLAVRAASGLSAAALGALNISNGTGSLANSLGMEGGPGGRNATMSPIRQHRDRKSVV